MGIICASNHAMGILTNAGPQPWHPARDETKKFGRKAAEYCKERDIELGKLAMYYSLQLKAPATFLVGMQTETELKINLEAFYNGLTDVEHAALEYILKKYCRPNSVRRKMKINKFDIYSICVKKTNWEGVETDQYFKR